VLAISFSSTDLVGHAFGPDSQEVQDIYAHLTPRWGRCSMSSTPFSDATHTSR
jgi:hypothetical protein